MTVNKIKSWENKTKQLTSKRDYNVSKALPNELRYKGIQNTVTKKIMNESKLICWNEIKW